MKRCRGSQGLSHTSKCLFAFLGNEWKAQGPFPVKREVYVTPEIKHLAFRALVCQWRDSHRVLLGAFGSLE